MKFQSLTLRLCIFACLIITPFQSHTQSFTYIIEENHPYQGCIQLENPPTENYKKEDLQVFIFPHNPDNPIPPIVGDWTEVNNKLYFCPLIPFTQSLTYQARFPNLPYFTFKPLPKKDYIPTEIIEVYPTATIIPENNLKMYVYFSAPMSEGNPYHFLSLENETRQRIANPFLELQPALWNEDRTRLTLWFDPGRVKRKLIKNVKMGAPLENGKAYTLKISKSWKDINGYSLANDFEKKLKVGPADRVRPQSANWKWNTPIVNTTTPLTIDFGESLDYALAKKAITILNEKAEPIIGKIALNQTSSQWIFTPTSRWAIGSYKIQIKATLEDLAGNNLNRLFDTDLEKEKSGSSEETYHFLSFDVN